MKELELTLRVRNNRLKERRKALGMTQSELAIAANVPLTAYCQLEALRCSPQIHDARDGRWRWREVALQLARFHCVEPDELFPPAVLKVETPVACHKVDGDDLFPLLSTHQQRLLEGPEAIQERTELREKLCCAFEDLCPRDAEVLRLRFGLDGDEEHTFEQIGAKLKITRERVRQIEARALHRLREPAMAKLLKQWH